MLALFNSINSAVCGALGINTYLQGVIIMVCINTIAVLGMSVLTGFTRLFSFGNAGFMSIGAYTAAILTVKFNVNFLLAIILGALFAGFIAFLLGSITLRLKGDYFLITCLGFGECVRVLFNYTKNITGGSAGYPGIPAYSNALFSLVCVVLAFFAAWRFIHSKYGRNLTSIRENEMAAEAVGINAFRVKVEAAGNDVRRLPYVHRSQQLQPCQELRAHHHHRDRRPRVPHRLRAGRHHRHGAAGDLPFPCQLPYAALRHGRGAHHPVQAQRPVRL